MQGWQEMGGTPPNVTVLPVRQRTEVALAPAAVGVVAAVAVPVAAAVVVLPLHLLLPAHVRTTMMVMLLPCRLQRPPLPTTSRPSVSRSTRRTPRWRRRR